MRKSKKQRYAYCDYNDTLIMTYINSDMALQGGKKSQNYNLQQGFGEQSETGAPSIYTQNTLVLYSKIVLV